MNFIKRYLWHCAVREWVSLIRLRRQRLADIHRIQAECTRMNRSTVESLPERYALIKTLELAMHSFRPIDDLLREAKIKRWLAKRAKQRIK